MRIVHIVPAMEQGGVESVVLTLSRALAGAGHEVFVISRGGTLVPPLEAAGARHVAFDAKSKNPLTVPLRVWKLRRILRDLRPDLVCTHSRVPAWLFRFANASLGIRWITYAHGANSVSAYSEIMTKGELTVVPSNYLGDYLREHYALDVSRLRVIPNAVESERFDPAKLDSEFVAEKRREWGIVGGERVAMAIGRISPLKGLDALLKACPSTVRLVIVGGADRDHAGYLETLKAKAGGNVVFAGPQTKVAECLSVADVLVSANVKKPETFGLAMAEALTMGVPVVAKAFGGALDVVRDGADGILFDGNDTVAEMRRAIEEALSRFASPECRSSIRESALRRFSVSAMLRETLAAYVR